MDVSVLQKAAKSGGSEVIVGVFKTAQMAQDAAEIDAGVPGIRWASTFGMSYSINDPRVGTSHRYTIFQFAVQAEQTGEFAGVSEESENALLNKLLRVLGRVPIGARDFIRVLTHPDVIDHTEEYVRAKRLEDQ